MDQGGDNSSPNNGKCNVKIKGLRHQCTTTDECEYSMVCRENNSTKNTILGKISKNNVMEKLCFCDDENGFMENIVEHDCNGK
jgi:hypothetical protein